jgi:ketosteroid isomerase-like protein
LLIDVPSGEVSIAGVPQTIDQRPCVLWPPVTRAVLRQVPRRRITLNPQKQAMKRRLLLVLAGLAIGFALPALAQQTNTPDPQLRQEFVAFLKKLDETYNDNDANAVAANFTQDAVLVTPFGPIFGRPYIKQWYAELFKSVHFSNLLSTADEDSPHLICRERNALLATGKWGTSGQGHTGGSAEAKGYWAAICTREGEDWKLRMLSSHFTIEPVATGATTPSPTATPSTQ